MPTKAELEAAGLAVHRQMWPTLLPNERGYPKHTLRKAMEAAEAALIAAEALGQPETEREAVARLLADTEAICTESVDITTCEAALRGLDQLRASARAAVDSYRASIETEGECPDCGGTGRIRRQKDWRIDPCSFCSGTGKEGEK